MGRPVDSGIRWVEELVAIAGGDPIFPELTDARLARNRIVKASEVVRRNPEVVFASWCGKKVQEARIREREGWDHTYLALQAFFEQGQIPALPIAEMLRTLITVTIVPVAGGMIVRAITPGFAERALEPLRRMVLVLLVVLSRRRCPATRTAGSPDERVHDGDGFLPVARRLIRDEAAHPASRGK